MLEIDLRGKRAFVAGVADDGGFGFAISKKLAEAGATVCVGTWPPAYNIFTKLIETGRIAESLVLAGGGTLEFERIYALDAEYDTLDDAPIELRETAATRRTPTSPSRALPTASSTTSASSRSTSSCTAWRTAAR